MLNRDVRIGSLDILHGVRLGSAHRLVPGQDSQGQYKRKQTHGENSKERVLVPLHQRRPATHLRVVAAVGRERDDVQDRDSEGRAELQASVVQRTDEPLVGVGGVTDSRQLDGKLRKADAKDVDDQGWEGDVPVRGVLCHKGEHQGGDAAEQETREDEGLEREAREDAAQDGEDNYGEQGVDKETDGGLQGVPAVNLLEDHVDIVDDALEGAKGDKGEDKGGGEGAALPNTQRHQRRIDLGLEEDESDKQSNTSNQHREGLGVSPAFFNTGRDVVDHTGDTQSRHDGTQEIDLWLFSLARRLWNGKESENQKKSAGNRRDAEDPPPANARDQATSEQDASDSAQTTESCKNGEGFGALGSWGEVDGDQRHGRGDRGSGPHTLEGAREDEHDRGGGKADDEGPEREPEEAEHEHAAVAKEITKTARDEEEARKSDGVGVKDPEGLGGFELEVFGDREEGYGNGGTVDYVGEGNEVDRVST